MPILWLKSGIFDPRGLSVPAPQSLQNVHDHDTLSPRDLALALGVSESSVRRWVDRGEIPSHRTRGGHRRIALADALAYARRAGLPWQHIESPAGGFPAPGSPASIEALERALRAGDERGGRSSLLAEYLAGRGVAELFDLWIRPAMAQIGELWQGGMEGILVEHRATAVCLGIVHRLGTLLPTERDLRAVGCGLSGDPYSLPSAMARVVLESQGFQAIDLGPDTPLAVLEEAVAEFSPHLVWLALSAAPDPKERRKELIGLLERLPAGPTLALGGRALRALDIPPHERLHQADSMRELSALALGLRSASKPKLGA